MRVIQFLFSPQIIAFGIDSETTILDILNELNNEIQACHQHEQEQFKIETIDFTEFKNKFNSDLENPNELDWLLSQLTSYLLELSIVVTDFEVTLIKK